MGHEILGLYIVQHQCIGAVDKPGKTGSILMLPVSLRDAHTMRSHNPRHTNGSSLIILVIKRHNFTEIVQFDSQN